MCLSTSSLTRPVWGAKRPLISAGTERSPDCCAAGDGCICDGMLVEAFETSRPVLVRALRTFWTLWGAGSCSGSRED